MTLTTNLMGFSHLFLLNPEFFPGLRITDKFSNRFSFNLVNKKEKEKYKIHAQELDDMVLHNSSLPQTTLMITDASIKNDIATFVKIADNGLYFIFPFHFILFLFFSFFPFIFYFSIFRTTQVRGYQSRCHISHNLMA